MPHSSVRAGRVGLPNVRRVPCAARQRRHALQQSVINAEVSEGALYVGAVQALIGVQQRHVLHTACSPQHTSLRTGKMETG